MTIMIAVDIIYHFSWFEKRYKLRYTYFVFCECAVAAVTDGDDVDDMNNVGVYAVVNGSRAQISEPKIMICKPNVLMNRWDVWVKIDIIIMIVTIYFCVTNSLYAIWERWEYWWWWTLYNAKRNFIFSLLNSKFIQYNYSITHVSVSCSNRYFTIELLKPQMKFETLHIYVMFNDDEVAIEICINANLLFNRYFVWFVCKWFISFIICGSYSQII